MNKIKLLFIIILANNLVAGINPKLATDPLKVEIRIRGESTVQFKKEFSIVVLHLPDGNPTLGKHYPARFDTSRKTWVAKIKTFDENTDRVEVQVYSKISEREISRKNRKISRNPLTFTFYLLAIKADPAKYSIIYTDKTNPNKESYNRHSPTKGQIQVLFRKKFDWFLELTLKDKARWRPPRISAGDFHEYNQYKKTYSKERRAPDSGPFNTITLKHKSQ